MTTTLNPLDLYRECIPVARAAFDDAFGLLPVHQRRRDMVRRLWGQVHAQVPEMPEPKVDQWFDGSVEISWGADRWILAAHLGAGGGYTLRSWHCGAQAQVTGTRYSIQPLLRVCQRFVTATVREVR